MKYFEAFFLTIQRLLPKRKISEIFGKVASYNGWPSHILKHLFKLVYDIEMEDALKKKVGLYPNLNALFTRQLIPNSRQQPADSSSFSSPADGKITQLGKIKGNTLIQAKGIQYNLADLMAGDSEIVQHFENGNFSCVYLAPHNYHRVHMPYTGKLKAARYIPGELFSVNQLTTRGIKDLYCKNERVVLVFQNESLYFSIIMVGACLVGGIAVLLPNPEGHIQKHIPGIEWTSYFEPHLATPSILRGTEIGYFYFGSTVILLTSRDSPGWLQSLEKDTLVQVGDPLT